MEKFLKQNWLLLLLWVFVSLLIIVSFSYYGTDPRLSSGAMASSTVTLVFITLFYAKQTRRLVEESTKDREEMIKKRNIDFLERVIELFLQPMLIKLNDMRKLTSKTEITSEEMNKVLADIYAFFFGRRYMISEENASKVSEMIGHFLELVDWNKETKKKFFGSESAVREIMVAELESAEDKIRNFYGIKLGK